MKLNEIFISFSLALLGFCGSALFAQKPIIQTCYTSDFTPMVHGDTLYVYTGRDEAGADFLGAPLGVNLPYEDAYYDGPIRLFAFMHLSGKYGIIFPNSNAI